MGADVSCHGISYSFEDELVLRDVNLCVSAGEAVALVGPSGCGKSTLLLCLAGVLQPKAGSVLIDGVSTDGLSDDARADLRAQRFGFVMQFGDLVAELTLEENVRVPQLIGGRSLGRGTPGALLTRLGLGELGERLPGEVSGGQRQRAAVARAVAGRPDVIFADEPTGALDSENGELVLEMLLETSRDIGATLIVVTHDESILDRFDRVIRLRDGRVVGR